MNARAAVGLAGLLALPGPLVRLAGVHLGTVTDTALFGLAIVAAAFLLSWAAEAAEVDISQAMAIAFIALIAVLPEYAVSVAFAWKAGQDPEFAHYAVANMTGANRLLIGLGWPLVCYVYVWRTRARLLRLEGGDAVAIAALAAATVYSFVIPATGEIGLYDSVVLFALFAVYIRMIATASRGEPELVGPARAIGGLPSLQRRTVIGALFAYAALVILATADPFAEGLVHTGEQLGIDRFLLVQWLAPLASEAPEFVIAILLAFRGRATGMGALLSSKVNQWTLLMGSIAIAYGISGRTLGGLPLDGRQMEEVLLTAAQSLMGIAVLLSLTLSRRRATALLVLFAVQFFFPGQHVRIAIAVAYLLIATVLIVAQRRQLPVLWRMVRATWRPRSPEPGRAPTATEVHD